MKCARFLGKMLQSTTARRLKAVCVIGFRGHWKPGLWWRVDALPRSAMGCGPIFWFAEASRESKVTVIPNAVDVESFAYDPRRSPNCAPAARSGRQYRTRFRRFLLRLRIGPAPPIPLAGWLSVPQLKECSGRRRLPMPLCGSRLWKAQPGRPRRLHRPGTSFRSPALLRADLCRATREIPMPADRCGDAAEALWRWPGANCWSFPM